MALIVLSCPMISIFAKGKKKPHLDRITVRNSYSKDKILSVQLQWKDRHGAHGTLPSTETVQAGKQGTFKAPLLGYKILSVTVYCDGQKGYINGRSNHYFVAKPGRKNDKTHTISVQGYSNETIYNAYQRINKVMKLKKKSDEAAAKATVAAPNVAIQTTTTTTTTTMGSPVVDVQTAAATALANYNAAVKALSPADATYFQALLTFQAAKKSANAMIPAQTESNQAAVQAATAAQTAAKAALPAAQKIFDAARQAFEKAQSITPVVKGTAVVGTPAASADDSDYDFDGE